MGELERCCENDGLHHINLMTLIISRDILGWISGENLQETSVFFSKLRVFLQMFQVFHQFLGLFDGFPAIFPMKNGTFASSEKAAVTHLATEVPAPMMSALTLAKWWINGWFDGDWMGCNVIWMGFNSHSIGFQWNFMGFQGEAPQWCLLVG